MIYWPIYILLAIGFGGLGAYAVHLYKKPAPRNRPDRNQEYKVGLIGAGSAVFGVVAGALVSIFIANIQLDEGRHDDTREMRGEVYLEFMRASGEYGVQTTRLGDLMDTMTPEQKAKLTLWSAPAKPWYEAREKFTDATNKVYIYGSDAALSIAIEVQDMFSLSTATGGVVIDSNLDQDQYDAEIEKFRQVFCREVPADPRDGCR
jgi:hypothetical protein